MISEKNTITRCAGSAAVQLSDAILEQVQLVTGDAVVVSTVGDRIIIEPAQRAPLPDDDIQALEVRVHQAQEEMRYYLKNFDNHDNHEGIES